MLKRLSDRPLVASFCARDSRSGHDVVIKVFDDSLARDRAFIGRLEAEVELQHTSLHPGLARLAGHFRRGDSLAVYRDYVDGISLAEYIAARGSPLELREVRALVRPLLEALSTLHAAGLCHLGLSATNVILRPDEGAAPLVCDIGVARIFGSHLPDTGRLDTGFAAPELRGGLSAVDMRADVFSVGVLLAVMLSAVRDDRSRSTDEMIGALAPPVSRLVGRCLADSPVERFADAGELLRALGSLAAQEDTAEYNDVDQSARLQQPTRPVPAVSSAATPEAPSESELADLLAARDSSSAIVRNQVPRPERSSRPPARRRGAPRVAVRKRPEAVPLSRAPTDRGDRPQIANPGLRADDTPRYGGTVETPQRPIEAVSLSADPGLDRPTATAGEELRTLTSELEAAAEIGAAGALNGEVDDTGLPPSLTNEPRDGLRSGRSSGELTRVPTGGESRQIRTVPRAYLTAPPTASLPAVSAASPRPPRHTGLLVVVMLAVLALGAFGIERVMTSNPEPPSTAEAHTSTQRPRPPVTALAPASEETPRDIVALRPAHSTGPAQPADPSPDPVASVQPARTEPLPTVEFPPIGERPAPDAARATSLRFDETLWAQGNRWILRHRVDASHPVDDREFYISREVVSSSPHPWGTRVRLIETGGDTPPRTIDLIASATCLIDPATERIDLCLPARADELVPRSVAGTEVPVFGIADEERDIIFAPSLGWVDASWQDERGNLVRTSLVGWRVGTTEGGELDHPTPTCSWAQVVDRGVGIGRTDRPEPLSRELAMAVGWGLEGRLRRLEIPLSGRSGMQRLFAWSSRYRSAYLVSAATDPPTSPTRAPSSVLELPFERAWAWADEAGGDVVALVFSKDGRHAVDLVTVTREGEVEVERVLNPSETALGAARVELVPSPSGCSLEVVQTLNDGAVHFATFDLDSDRPVRTGGDL